MKRYSAQEDGAWVSEFISSRRTTRDFLPTPVPTELIEQILKDSLTAPSWSNTRPFKVAVATGEVRDRISNEFLSRWQALSTAMRGGIWSKIKLFIKCHGLPTSNRIILKPYVAELKPRAQRVGKELYGSLGVQRGDKAERDRQWGKNYEFFGAPVAMFVYIHKSLHIYAAADAGLMMENLMLSAHAHGLGTCAQGAVAFWDDAIRDEFEVSKDYRLLCGIAVGYPSDAPVNSFEAHRIGLDELLAKAKQKKK